MKILLLDLETSPNLAYVWGLWNQNVAINQLVSSTEVICFGAQWYGQNKVYFRSIHHDGKKAMLEEIHKLLDEADAVVGWNSAGFDMKHLRREFVENDMLPPSPTKDIDLMLVAKKQFRFPSNKLDYVAQKLEIGQKVQHSGFDLWVKCMAGESKAWAEMKRYQVQDVKLLVELYEKFLPWITTHPNRALIDGRPDACINCGGTSIYSHGFHVTGAGKYRRFRCIDCGKWMRGPTSVAKSEYRNAT